MKSRNLAEKKFDYKCLLSRNIHEENCLKSENIGDIASSYDFRSQVDSSAVFDAQYDSCGLAKADRRPREKKKFYHQFSIVKYSYFPTDTFRKYVERHVNWELPIDFEVPRLLQALMCV